MVLFGFSLSFIKNPLSLKQMKSLLFTFLILSGFIIVVINFAIMFNFLENLKFVLFFFVVLSVVVFLTTPSWGSTLEELGF